MSARKKTAKKAARKKAAKKKSARKKGGGRDRVGVHPKHYVISIRSSIPCSFEQGTKKNRASSRPDTVKWRSEDGDYELTFGAGWPFKTAPDKGDPTDLVNNPPIIVVNPLSDSRVFKIDPDLANNRYPYDIQPPAVPHPRGGEKPGPVIDVSGP